LAYLIVFSVLRPDRRAKPLNFAKAVQNWLMAVGLALATLVLTGWFVYGAWPNVMTLARQIGLVTLFLPLAVLIRRAVRYALTDPDEREF
jgi:multisubunit Na+/H+ antiporter MnhB subunit